MSGNILIQYVGFEAKPLVREYTFSVREAGQLREFTFTIPNEAFDSRRIRYQDAPDFCSLKLRAELAANANRPPKTHYRITDAELDQYRESHLPKSVRSLYPKNGVRDA
jgi:hypothetical protein